MCGTAGTDKLSLESEAASLSERGDKEAAGFKSTKGLKFRIAHYSGHHREATMRLTDRDVLYQLKLLAYIHGDSIYLYKSL